MKNWEHWVFWGIAALGAGLWLWIEGAPKWASTMVLILLLSNAMRKDMDDWGEK